MAMTYPVFNSFQQVAEFKKALNHNTFDIVLAILLDYCRRAIMCSGPWVQKAYRDFFKGK